MLRRLPAVMLLAALSGAATWPAQAQGAEPSCTYDECSLRLERGRLLRGRPPGEVVGRFGVWSAPRLGPVVSSTDSAAAYAAVYDRHYVVGHRLYHVGALGSVTLALISLGHNEPEHRGIRASEWALLGASAALAGVMVYGGERMKRGSQALARALWWHNRELAR